VKSNRRKRPIGFAPWKEIMMLTLPLSAMPEVAGCYTLAARKQKIKGRGQGG
jgi:hypothetical protein